MYCNRYANGTAVANEVADEEQAISALALENVCDQIAAKPRLLWQTATGKRADSYVDRVPLVQLTVCGTEWGYGTLEKLIESSLPGVSLLPFYTHFSNCNCCVVDHVKSLRSGDKYLGLIESKYLAKLLQIPISYYTPNNSGRYLACCVASWVDPFITGGSCNKWIILGILTNTMFNVREC